MKVHSYAKKALAIVASMAMLLSCMVFSGMFISADATSMTADYDTAISNYKATGGSDNSGSAYASVNNGAQAIQVIDGEANLGRNASAGYMELSFAGEGAAPASFRIFGNSSTLPSNKGETGKWYLVDFWYQVQKLTAPGALYVAYGSARHDQTSSDDQVFQSSANGACNPNIIIARSYGKVDLAATETAGDWAEYKCLVYASVVQGFHVSLIVNGTRTNSKVFIDDMSVTEVDPATYARELFTNDFASGTFENSNGGSGTGTWKSATGATDNSWFTGAYQTYVTDAASKTDDGTGAMEFKYEKNFTKEEGTWVTAFRLFGKQGTYDSHKDTANWTSGWQSNYKFNQNTYYRLSFSYKAVNAPCDAKLAVATGSYNLSNPFNEASFTNPSGSPARTGAVGYVAIPASETEGDWQTAEVVFKPTTASNQNGLVLGLIPGDIACNGLNVLVDDIKVEWLDPLMVTEVKTVANYEGGADKTIVVGKGAAMPTLPAPAAREGYEFVKYTQDVAGNVKMNSTVWGPTVAYAQWNQIAYGATVNFVVPEHATIEKTSAGVDVGAPIPFPQVTCDFGYMPDGWWTAAEGGDPAPENAVDGENTYYLHLKQAVQDFEGIDVSALEGNSSAQNLSTEIKHGGEQAAAWKMNQDYRGNTTYARYVVNYGGSRVTVPAGTGYKVTMWVYSEVADKFYPQVGALANPSQAWTGDSTTIMDADGNFVAQNGTDGDVYFDLPANEWTKITFTSGIVSAGKYLTIGGGFESKYDGLNPDEIAAIPDDQKAHDEEFGIEHKELKYVYVDDITLEEYHPYIPDDKVLDFEAIELGTELDLNTTETEKAVVSDELNHTYGDAATKSLKVTGRDGGGDGRTQFVLTDNLGNKFTTKANYTYTVSVWVYSEDTNTFRMWLAEGDDKTVFQQGAITYRHNRDSSAHIAQTGNLTLTTGEWTKFTLSFKSTAPAEGDVLRLGVSETTGKNSYTYYLDDITVDVAKPYSPTRGLWDMEGMELKTKIALNTDTKDAATVSNEANHTVGGSKSLRIDSNDGSGDNRTQFILRDSDGNPVEAKSGYTYQISFWAMTTMTSDTTMRFWIADGDETTEFQNNNRPAKIVYRHNRGSSAHLIQDKEGMKYTLTTGEWQLFTGTYTPTKVEADKSPTQGDAPSYIRIGISHTNGTNSPHVFYVDDFICMTYDEKGEMTNTLIDKVDKFGLFVANGGGTLAGEIGETNGAIYTLKGDAAGTEYTAIRVFANYKTTSADCDTLSFAGNAYKIKERGIMVGKASDFNDSDNPLDITQYNYDLVTSKTGNFDDCWEYDEDTGVCTYSLLIKNISKDDAAVDFVYRSYMIIEMNGAEKVIYGNLSTAVSAEAIHAAAEEKTGGPGTITWFTKEEPV